MCQKNAHSNTAEKPLNHADGASANPDDRITIAPHTPTLDKSVLESCSTERAFLIEVCESFLTDVHHRSQALQQALTQNNTQAMIETAHALKSLSSCVGAMRLFHICQIIESTARTGNEIKKSSVSSQVKTECEQIQVAIQNYQNAA